MGDTSRRRKDRENGRKEEEKEGRRRDGRDVKNTPPLEICF